MKERRSPYSRAFRPFTACHGSLPTKSVYLSHHQCKLNTCCAKRQINLVGPNWLRAVAVGIVVLDDDCAVLLDMRFGQHVKSTGSVNYFQKKRWPIFVFPGYRACVCLVLQSANAQRKRLAQGATVVQRKCAKSTHDEALLDCRKHGFEHGKLDEPCRLPIGDKCFTETEWCAHLAGNRHDDEIAPIRVVSLTRNDDGRTFFRTRRAQPRSLLRQPSWFLQNE